MKLFDLMEAGGVPDNSKIMDFLKRYFPGARFTTLVRSTGNNQSIALSTKMTTKESVAYQVTASIYGSNRIQVSNAQDVDDEVIKAHLMAAPNLSIGNLKNKDKVTAFVVDLKGEKYYFSFKKLNSTNAARNNPEAIAKAKKAKEEIEEIKRSNKSAKQKAEEIQKIVKNTWAAFGAGLKSNDPSADILNNILGPFATALNNQNRRR